MTMNAHSVLPGVRSRRVFAFHLCLYVSIGIGNACFSQPLRTGARHLIIIGIDGLSTDGIQVARTPNIDRLIRDGAFTLSARGVMPTVSAPNWESILCGAGPEQHGVTRNGWTVGNHTIDATAPDAEGYFPSIFSLLKAKRPSAGIAMFYDWEALAELFNPSAIDTKNFSDGYFQTFGKAGAWMIVEKPLLTFIYSGEPDEAGHAFGHGTPEYYRAIERVDSCLGAFLDALTTAGLYQKCNFLLVSDHGGVGKGHGGESMEELQVPWLVAGPGVRKNCMLRNPVDAMQTAATAAYLLGIEPHEAWIARPVMEAFAKGGGKAGEIQTYVPKPVASMRSGLYTEPQTLPLRSKEPAAEIRYTVDGTLPTAESPVFPGSIALERSTLLKAAAFIAGSASEPVTIRYTRIEGIRSASFANPPGSRYPGEGPLSLFDGRRGIKNYKEPGWSGFEGNDLDVTVDFGGLRAVKGIDVEFYQDSSAWIFLPAELELFVSDDGAAYMPANDYHLVSAPPGLKPGPVSVTIPAQPFQKRFMRIRAKNIGVCPPGHPGAGSKAWLFVDEVLIR